MSKNDRPRSQYPNALLLRLDRLQSSDVLYEMRIPDTYIAASHLVIYVQVLEETLLLRRSNLYHMRANERRKDA